MLIGKVIRNSDLLIRGKSSVADEHHSQKKIYKNLSYKDIYDHEMNDMESTTTTGAVAIKTGIFTGRSPKDKYIVKRAPSSDNIWWGHVNQPIASEIFDELKAKVDEHYDNAEKVYIFEGFCGSNPNSRRKIRIISEIAWQHHFVTNMFIRPTSEELVDFEKNGFEPDFTIINACKIENDKWKEHGLNSPVFVCMDVENKTGLIGGTWYGGEMKKGIFSMMNYWLPLDGQVSMHCSANIGKDKKDTALFFGLSGTGKTTLSADSNRLLIGDDEHGWDNEGIFNFEGGCYAKTINLSRENEPEIYDAIKRNALLENVAVNSKGEIDYSDTSITENGRVSYPLFHIDNIKQDSMGDHPENIFFLAADAFGVLPPIARLNEKQAMYHFLSGYTAKVAGTERGVTEPTATFSACFGAAFLTLHPTVYASLLEQKLKTHGTNVYLINSGWCGGAAGEVDRLPISTTRRCINSVLNGDILNATFESDPYFGFEVPVELPGLTKNDLSPKLIWNNDSAYTSQADKLVQLFKNNFKQFANAGQGLPDYTPHGPN